MYYKCNNEECGFQEKTEDEEQKKTNCPECNGLLFYDSGPYGSEEEYEEDMEEMMFPEGRDDGFDVEDMFDSD
jgi:DNA-directed RNA polymerase subunit RPC12/RpoP